MITLLAVGFVLIHLFVGGFAHSVGTRSVMAGAHCWFLHPWFVAYGWWKLYGFPWDPRLWVAFFVHDLGYVGKPNMDGEEGEQHPLLGARIMWRLFDRGRDQTWYRFTLYHSRYFAKSMGVQPSKLCVADKYALAVEPWWLYLPRAHLTGEISEYMMRAGRRIRNNEAVSPTEKTYLLSKDPKEWYRGVQAYMRRWVDEHKDGRADYWTAFNREDAQ